MRILYVPFFSNLNLAGCSIFNSMKVLLKTLVERYENVQVFYPYPDHPDFDASAMKYLEHPRIKALPCSARVLQSEDVVYVPGDLIDQFKTSTGQYHVDLVICDKQRVSTWVDLMLNDHVRAVGGSVPMVNFVQWPAERDGRTEHYSEAFEYSQVMGLMTGWNIWGGRLDYEMGLRVARKYGTARVIKHVIDKSFHGIGTVLDCDRLDKLMKDKPKDHIRVNYASRFGSHYEFEELFAEVEKLYQSGRKTKLVITSPSPAPGNVGNRVLKEMNHREMDYELNFKCPQAEFYGKASQCHVSLWLIKEMGPSLSLREQVYMRQALVMPKTPPFQALLPDYPFMYEDAKQMRTMLRYVVDNYWGDEIQGIVEKYRNYVRENYDVGSGIGRLHEFLKERVAEETKVHKSIVEMTREAFDTIGWPEEMNYEQFRAIVKKGTRTKRDVEVNYTGFSRNYFRWALPQLGYVDTYKEFVPTWVRVTKDGSPAPGAHPITHG